MSKQALWRYITGEKGINRIRVYERVPGGPIQVEWYDRNGRHQKSLTSLAGIPLRGDSEHDRDLAKQLAERMAAGQRKERQAQVAHQLLGLPMPYTLGELLDEYHEAHPDWSGGHVKQQRENRNYWLDRLGADRLLTSITPAIASNVVKNDTQRTGGEGVGKRTQANRLRYLKDAFTFAQKQLKWITEADNLSALDPPRSEGE